MGKNKTKTAKKAARPQIEHTIILLIAIMIGGFFLRLYYLGQPSYWIDEGFTLMQAKAISFHGIPLLESGHIEYKDALLPYLLVPFQKIWGTDPIAMRILSVLFGTGSIYLLYFLGKNLFNKNVGLISSFFLSFSYWHIAWSRQARSYALLVFLMLAACSCLLLAEKKNSKRYLWSAFVIIILASFSKSAGILLVFPFVFYLLIKRRYKETAALAVIALVIAYFFRFLLINALDLSIVNYSRYYLIGYFWNHFGLMFVLSLVGFLLALRGEGTRAIHVFNFSIFLISLIFFSFLVYVNQFRYLFSVTPLLFLYGAFTIDYLSQFQWKREVAILLAVVAIDLFTVHSLSFMPQKFYALEKYTPQPDFQIAYKKVRAVIKKDDYLISPYPYMDLLYIGKSSYYLPISYTGRVKDKDNDKKEYYSGTPRTGLDEIKRLRKRTDIFFVFDEMANGRVSQDVQAYIKKEAQVIYENHDHQQIIVYELVLKPELAPAQN